MTTGSRGELRASAAVAAALLSVFTFVSPASAQNKTSAPPAKVTIIVGLTPGAPAVSIYWVGIPLGFFAEENIDPVILNAPNGNMAQGAQMAAAGQADAVLTSIESVVLPASQNKDTGLVFVYNFYTRPSFRLIVKDDSGYRSAADLKGKTIGISNSGNPDEPMLNAYLSDGGVNRKDVNVQVVGNGLPAAQAIKNGEIASAQEVAMTGAAWVHAGYSFRNLPEPKQFDDLIGAAVAVKRSALQDPERRSAIIRFLRAWAKSAAFVKANPRAAVELDFKMFPQAKPRGASDADAIKQGMDTQAAILDLYTNKVDGKWGAFRPTAFPSYVKFLGIADKIPDVNALWTNELNDEINKFDDAEPTEKANEFK
jgi:NitT/TauT family transport system substrate-binding protein